MKTFKRAMDSLLNRFGYYHTGVPEGAEVSEADVTELFQSYAADERFVKFLRDILKRDKDFYFNAQSDRERENIHGASSRTNYFIALIRKSNDKRNSRGSRNQ